MVNSFALILKKILTLKNSTQRSQGLLQPSPVPSKPWDELSMDFGVALPNSNGYTLIFVVVDRLTKGAHFIPLCPNFTASIVFTEFVKNVIKLHGFPRHIVFDRDPIFMSAFWHQIMKQSGIHLRHNTAYHPQSDGQAEVVKKVIGTILTFVFGVINLKFGFNTFHGLSCGTTPLFIQLWECLHIKLCMDFVPTSFLMHYQGRFQWM